MKNEKVLKTAQAIMEHYEMSWPAFKRFVEMGMPVRMIDGKYYAHVDNIDRFFKKITAFSLDEVSEEFD